MLCFRFKIASMDEVHDGPPEAHLSKLLLRGIARRLLASFLKPYAAIVPRDSFSSRVV